MYLHLFDVPPTERRLADTEGHLSRPERRGEEMDPLAQMAQANAADAILLRLVLCAAVATLVLALLMSRLVA